MKTIFISSLLLLNTNCSANPSKVENTPAQTHSNTAELADIDSGQARNMIKKHDDPVIALASKPQDTILNNIQERIAQATDYAFRDNSTVNLDKIEEELTNSSISNENLRNYWIAYTNYYKTIVGLKTQNEELSKEANEKGVKALETIKDKTSEDYALLALLKGLSFSFTSAMKAPGINRQINNYIKKGLESDSSNFRVHYAQASVDFYTPKQYGGGKKTEKHLLIAVELPEKNTENPQLPTWGREEVYDLLIRYYLRENQKDKAKEYYDEAGQLFPNGYVVMSHRKAFQN